LEYGAAESTGSVKRRIPVAQRIGRAKVLFFATVFALTRFGSQQLMAKTVQVGNCLIEPPHYATIQSAVSASAPGTTIKVCPGNYPEQVVINKKLTLTGAETGTGSTPIVTSPVGGIVQNATGLVASNPIGAQILVQNAPEVDISGLTVDGSGNQLSCTLDLMGIYYQNASGIINHVATRNQNLGSGSYCQSGEGIFAQSGYGYCGVSTVLIENSHVYAYQKNGISGDGDTLTVTISENDIVGQGPTPYVAQNGIQISDGTKGTILSNSVVNDIYSGASYSATGILVYASSDVFLNNNTVSNTQGIVVYSSGTDGSADQTTITSNRVLDTNTYDGIDICSSDNTVVSNTVFGSSEAGIHLNDGCVEANGGPSGNNNTVTKNRINDVCAGLLLGSGTGNTISPNSIFNADYVNLAGDACPATPSDIKTQGTPPKSRPRPVAARP
jgi:hypothetical protein